MQKETGTYEESMLVLSPPGNQSDFIALSAVKNKQTNDLGNLQPN